MVAGGATHSGAKADRVALETEQIDVAALQQAGVRGAMRNVARSASLGHLGGVLEDERTGFFHVTLEAYRILAGGGPQLRIYEAAMLVVAITALDQPLFDAVAEWPVEILLDVGMAPVTELRLFIDQQELLLFRVMG